MKTWNLFATTLGLLMALLMTNTALADKVTLKTNIEAAREKVLTMVSGKGDPIALKADIAKLSASIDAEIDTVPGLKPVWTQFRTNRDTKIIPAFDGTQPDSLESAKALAAGEQKELFGKMMEMLK
jgi:hypothetical protein